MFKKSSRIEKKDISNVIKEGVAYHSPSFTLKKLKNSSNATLFAVIVSKKVAKTAVSRNKNKRRVRECVKKQIHNIPQGNFYIIMLKKDLKETVFEDVKNEIRELFAKLK
jgi:ribonuclease P protein component